MSPEALASPPGDVFAAVPGVPSFKGVALNPPPGPILAQATELVRDAMAQVPPDKKGALVAIATKQGDAVNVNLALAVRAGNHVEVVSWLGRSWGEPVAGGAAVRVSF